MKDPQVLCKRCERWQLGRLHDWLLQPQSHNCRQSFSKDFFESHQEFYTRKLLKVIMTISEWR